MKPPWEKLDISLDEWLKQSLTDDEARLLMYFSACVEAGANPDPRSLDIPLDRQRVALDGLRKKGF